MALASAKQPERIEHFFVGVGKCGTSWIYSVLKAKGAVNVPAIKEPYLLDQPEERRRKLEQELWTEGGGRADFSNTYFFDPDNPHRIRDYNPQARIVITVRKPSDRTVSHFHHLQRNGQIARVSLEEYLAGDDKHAIVERSDYRPMIERYREVFGRERVLVLPLEHLRADAQGYIDRLAEFLGLAPIALTPEDRAPVMVRSRPRFGMLGRLVKAAANVLRSMGLLKLLGTLKSSRLVERLVYTRVEASAGHAFGRRASEIARLDEDYRRILAEEGLASACG